MGPQGEDLLKLFARDGTALLKVLLKAGASEPSPVFCAGWDRLAESLAESGGIRGLVRVVLAGMNRQGEDLLKLFGGMNPQGEDLLKLLGGMGPQGSYS